MLRLLLVVALLFLQACGEGLPSGQLSNGLTPPSDILVTSGNKSATITWSTEAGSTYYIYWTTNSSLSEEQWAKITVNTSPYTHTGLLNGTTYYYRLTTVKNGKESSLSPIIPVTPSVSGLNPPVNVIVETGDEQITLSWSPSPGATQYKVYWTLNPDQNPKLSGNPPKISEGTSYLFGNLVNDTTYYFVVTAVAGETESPPTEKVWAKPSMSRPESPTNLKVVNLGPNEATFSWDSSVGATGYRVYWGKGTPDFALPLAGSEDISKDQLEYTVRQLEKGVTYYVRVAAINENGVGEPSVALKIPTDLPVTTDPSVAPPTQVKVIINGVAAEITWSIDNFQRNYKMFYATEPGVTPDNYVQLENGSASVEYQTPKGQIKDLIVGKTYYLVVVAIAGNLQSVHSSEISFEVPIPKSQYDRADIEAGGRLYARWYQPLNTPKAYHPLWEEAVKDAKGATISQATAAESWTCAECHGWDYKGADGEYGYGSKRYTGFPGVAGLEGKKSPEKIYNFILSGKTTSGKDHSFPTMPQVDAIALTKFILEATTADKLWVGNEADGDLIFNGPQQVIPACTNNGCHTQFTDIKNSDVLPRVLGETAKSVHIIRYGFNTMPGGRSLQDARDVLRYLWKNEIKDATNNFSQATYDKTGSDLNNQIAKGGVLYDRWWLSRSAEKFALPLGNHPLWPEGITSLNSSYTWRCQACHGWDYRGNVGDYKAGVYYTGIPGILQSTGASDTPEDLYQFLRADEFHAFSMFLNDNDIYALTRFVMTMRDEEQNSLAPHQQMDLIKEEPLQASPDQGKQQYFLPAASGGCDTCHVKNGSTWFFNDISPDRNEIQTLATIAKENPWEFLHKVRFGQPGSIMQGVLQYPNFADLSAYEILAFVQTELDQDIKRGGRLYDTWWEENKLNEPTGQHPLWPVAGSALSATDTWRCSSCHGWDYNGAEGFTGLLSLMQDTKSFISSGTVINTDDHAFAAKLKKQDISDLVAFITDTNRNGVRDDINDLIVSANSSNGQQIYHGVTPGNCVNCHGTKGTAIPTVDLKTLAGNFAQRFIHVARFGSPGSSMLPGLSRFTGLTANQAADVQSYTVTFSNTGSSSSSLDRGGRLFDNWFAEMRASDPAVLDPVLVNPLWERRNPSVPDVQSLSDSWRCVNCHNWNYKGKDILVDSPDADNLLLKIEQRSVLYPDEQALKEYLKTWIKNGTGKEHNYGTEQSGLPSVLGDRELEDLTTFLLQGVLDSSLYIMNLDGRAIGADLARGKEIYEGITLVDLDCSSCHGASGESTPPGSSRVLDIFALAKNNPWAFLHKVRFAAPATEMPALEGIPSATIKDAVDILGYAQRQFEQRVP